MTLQQGGVQLEKKVLNAIFNKSGSGSYTPRISFPITWFRKLGITQEEKAVEVIYDEENEQIILKKAK